MSWIRFDLQPRMPSRKTDRWQVMTTSGESSLGVVAWFSHWRKYAFYPAPWTVYEEDCLREIAAFCVEKTRKHKGKAA